MFVCFLARERRIDLRASVQTMRRPLSTAMDIEILRSLARVAPDRDRKCRGADARQAQRAAEEIGEPMVRARIAGR